MNVYPAAIETVLEHPGVGEAVVVGIPDERWGEKVHAFTDHVPRGRGDQVPAK
ncbi:hypothetical protein ACIGMX_32565 [Streptomyces aquilus]|uniref:AMP-binding enzyme n=1 Tax=Streptomyces aquilus TaxID=2548456 RepID=UPI0037CE7AEA